MILAFYSQNSEEVKAEALVAAQEKDPVCQIMCIELHQLIKWAYVCLFLRRLMT